MAVLQGRNERCSTTWLPVVLLGRRYKSESMLDRQPLHLAHLHPWWVLTVTELLVKWLKLLLLLSWNKITQKLSGRGACQIIQISVRLNRSPDRAYLRQPAGHNSSFHFAPVEIGFLILPHHLKTHHFFLWIRAHVLAVDVVQTPELTQVLTESA